MSEDHLADNFYWHSWSRGIGRCVSSEIMRLQMDPYYLSCFIHNFSFGRIRYWKYPLIRPNPFSGYVFLETIGNLPRDKDNLPFLAALGGSESELSVLDVIGCQFQSLADPHSTSGAGDLGPFRRNEPLIWRGSTCSFWLFFWMKIVILQPIMDALRDSHSTPHFYFL